MEAEVFLDTAYAIALASKRDNLHQQAVTLAQEIQEYSTRLVTTKAVLLEIGNALSGLRHRKAAVALLAALDADPRVGVVSLTDDLYQEAFELFQNRPDKEWGLVDCCSFVVMKQRGINSALTSDLHFRQAGFTTLLTE